MKEVVQSMSSRGAATRQLSEPSSWLPVSSWLWRDFPWELPWPIPSLVRLSAHFHRSAVISNIVIFSCLDLIFISLMYFQLTGYMDGHIGSWRLFRSSSMSHLRHKYLFGIRSFSGVRFHDGDHGPRSHVASHLLPSSCPLSLRRHRRTHSFFDNLKNIVATFIVWELTVNG